MEGHVDYFDLSIEEREATLKRATHDAIARQHAAGLNTTHSDGQDIFEITPNGEKTNVRPLSPLPRAAKKHLKVS